MSNYQARYLAHQLRKKKVLEKLLKQRHSTRVFADKEVETKKIEELMRIREVCPSSCDRQAVYALPYWERDKKALLGGVLVGGVGWIHRAPYVFLLFADSKAYVEGTSYMPYLDAGVLVGNMYLVAESLGLKACYVNPNIRDEHKLYFEDAFGKNIFCGAFAVGYEKK